MFFPPSLFSTPPPPKFAHECNDACGQNFRILGKICRIVEGGVPTYRVENTVEKFQRNFVLVISRLCLNSQRPNASVSHSAVLSHRSTCFSLWNSFEENNPRGTCRRAREVGYFLRKRGRILASSIP